MQEANIVTDKPTTPDTPTSETANQVVAINPVGSMNLLSQWEVDLVKHSADSPLYQLFRNCALAVLNCGSESDNVADMLEEHRSFDINVLRRGRGVKLELINPPASAFVDGELIVGINEHLFAVLRDILFVAGKHGDLLGGAIPPRVATNLLFDILRHANVFEANLPPNLVVCWGGHSISALEYDYSKEVGYQLGLRGLDVCTGCGPGAMKGPMKGAAVGHAKQRISRGQYVGLSEPGIIAAEAPNPIVNQLVILPDIEKRLESFVRVGHAIIIFPGGVGTAEELLYILGIMLHANNRDHALPIILTGPAKSANYFEVLDEFIGRTLGAQAQALYQIVIDNPAEVARLCKVSMAEVRAFRKSTGDAYHFNWGLHIDPQFQQPFKPSHETMSQLPLFFDGDKAELAANLRRVFSGIVAGNVKPEGLAAIIEHGPFEIHGDPELMKLLDQLLSQFVAQGRMKLPGTQYSPCYRVKVG
ncbi:LOG family protein [Pseudomaricurvus alkylphenolicus]|jgi:predicted Rossmann-fold nucleotide-binding protein|uniref:nucleotide 5'-monophosphate nucleosidase PpnN n=1 Tax=Pseudomaricurvus alkylphenolicus TaxID=1306991 RepID=UPI0014245B56|nr:nucleotide 5'-monophosphate nucleosidase PpnN [Pseudomaricurvus alkylphenolicus]NIB41934.1 LOG family protein [Pseudomaricurvus alkylphenolicus]